MRDRVLKALDENSPCEQEDVVVGRLAVLVNDNAEDADIGGLARKSMPSRSSRGRVDSSAQRLDRAVLGDAPDERRRFFAGDSLNDCARLFQDRDGTFRRQIGGDHDEDPEAGLAQGRHLGRSIPDVRILRQKHPATLGDRRKQVHIFGGRSEVVIVRLDVPAQRKKAGRNPATEIAVAEEDYAAGRNQSSYLSACSTSAGVRPKSPAMVLMASSASKRPLMISVRTPLT